jgi:ketosteroid isomerase-like protein
VQHIAFLFDTEPEKPCNLHVALKTLIAPVLNETASYGRLREIPAVGRYITNDSQSSGKMKTNSEVAQQKDTADSQTAQKILAITLAFNEASGNSDAAAIAALFTEDGLFVTDRGPVYGREAIQKWYEDLFQQLKIKKHVGIPDQGCPHTIGTTGNEVWENGEWSETIQLESGDLIEMKGYWSTIDRRESDDWKIRMLTVNVTPAPVPETK